MSNTTGYTCRWCGSTKSRRLMRRLADGWECTSAVACVVAKWGIR